MQPICEHSGSRRARYASITESVINYVSNSLQSSTNRSISVDRFSSPSRDILLLYLKVYQNQVAAFLSVIDKSTSFTFPEDTQWNMSALSRIKDLQSLSSLRGASSICCLPGLVSQKSDSEILTVVEFQTMLFLKVCIRSICVFECFCVITILLHYTFHVVG